jgi:hypothetical protein
MRLGDICSNHDFFPYFLLLSPGLLAHTIILFNIVILKELRENVMLNLFPLKTSAEKFHF